MKLSPVVASLILCGCCQSQPTDNHVLPSGAKTVSSAVQSAPQIHDLTLLYYFEQGGLIGVKSGDGKVVIEPAYPSFRAYDMNFPITTPYIELWGGAVANYPKDALAYPAGDVYDRQGNLLYRPMAFDNGFDYWQEGLRRYVNDKAQVGFVDRVGKVVIPAQYQFVSPFNYGYAQVYVGNWQSHYSNGGDYLGIRPADDTATFYFINKQGQRVDGYDKPKHPKDMHHEGKYYPYPFKYTAFEQKLLDNLKSLVFELYTDMYLEISERPSPYFPYYRVQAYHKQDFHQDWQSSYLVSQTGQVFTENSFGEIKPIAKLNLYE